MTIATLDLPVGAALAPMAGVTCQPFRLLCHEQGAAWTVTEMLSAKGFTYAGRALRAVRDLIAHSAGEGVVGLQLFGREPERIREAADALSREGFAFIDINMGCPAHKIAGNGEGSALMREPVLAGQIVRAAVEASPLPVTIKIRAGWDAGHINAVEIARICEDNGASAVAVHARTREQMYAGRADWRVIADVARAVRIPVIGNGDVDSGESALRMLRETGCQGVMVGRAAQGNPWIFAEIRAAMLGLPYTPPDISARVNMAVRHLDMLCALHGDKAAVPEMRSHIAWYLRGWRNCARLRAEINGMTEREQVRDALLSIRDS